MRTALSYSGWTCNTLYKPIVDSGPKGEYSSLFDPEAFAFADRLSRHDMQCVHCSIPLQSVFQESADLVSWHKGYEANEVFECQRCGWWFYERYWDLDTWESDTTSQDFYQAILKSVSGDMAKQIADVPDGSSIRLRVT